MIKRSFLLLTIVLLCSLTAMAQPFRIFGKVVDDSTRVPIPFASVAIAELNLGTSTNINGEFLIKLDSLPAGLIFTHVSYERQEITVQSVDYVTIYLKPRKIILEELVIKDDQAGDYPYKLMIGALNNAIQKSRDWKYGLAYYRQTSSNDDDYSELYEIFYDTRYSNQGIVDWDIQEGRYALKTDSISSEYVFNKNFTLLTRLITMFQPETEKFIMPVNEHVKELYDLKITELIDIDGRNVATVSFTPKEELYIPAMSGKILIDIDSYDILKLQGQFTDNNLDIVALTNPKGSWKNLTLSIEAAFKPQEDNILLDYVSMHQSFDYFIEERFCHHVETHSFLTYYEYYQPEKFKRLGGRLTRLMRSDRERLDRIGYNRRFWEENPIVLRTPVEEEIISSFEAANAFGSIYLNDREQIQLDKDELINDPFVQQLNVDLIKTKLAAFGEKVYIHFDKPYYASGETIWFNAYIVNIGSMILTDNSGVLYVDLISPTGQNLMHNRLLVTRGLCEGNIDLPEDLESGIIRVRAYTNWMKNFDEALFFSKEIPVYNLVDDLYTKNKRKTESKDFDIQFFPEGGHLIHDLASQIAFKAIDLKGIGIPVDGKIVNTDGKTIAEFSTRHKGMGSFFMNPQFQTGYKAIVKYGRMEKEFDFPAVRKDGYAITVNNLKNRNIQIVIKNSPSLDNSELYIIARARGRIYHREKTTVNRGSTVVSIPKAKFPDGIVQITVFNDQYIPVCERLVFINNQQTIDASIETENRVLSPREKISMKLFVKDQYGKAVRNTSFSLAVTDGDHFEKGNTRETITSNLLLSSDLKGIIEDPGSYFLADDRDARIALDLVMLTHGWRRYTWEDIREGSLATTEYAHESGIDIRGIALNSAKRPVTNAFLRFVPLNYHYFGLWEATTGVDGNFELKGMIIPDSTQVVVKYIDERGREEEARLKLDIPDRVMPDISPLRYPGLVINEDVLKYMDKYEKREIAYSMYEEEEPVVLKEIVVEDTKLDDLKLYGEPDNVIIIDDILANYSDIFQILQGRVPGVQVYGDGMNAQIRIRGVGSFSADNTPLFLIDGTPLSTAMQSLSILDTTSTEVVEEGITYINSTLMALSPRDIDRIEVLKGPSSSLYGVRGANGVIAIYTRKGSSVPRPGENDISDYIIYLPGFNLVKEFYSPKYDLEENEEQKPDNRTTLYWNPSVKTNNLGYAEITFFNSDEGKKLQIDLEGITDYGDPVNMTTFIGEEVVK